LGYQIDLEVFNGPMDLLLYLISKDEVDIQEISIARIVDQYMEYLERMRELNVDVTSDFIVMASTLTLIKSQTMLPTEEIDLEDEIDQQSELIRHLLEYKKIKMLSRGLREKAKNREELIPRPHITLSPKEEELSYDEVNLWDIIRAFAKVVKETSLHRSFDVVHSDKPISAYIASVLDKLSSEQQCEFTKFFEGEINRGDAICIFVALLELMKRKVVTVVQPEGSEDILVKLILDIDFLNTIKKDGIYHVHLLDVNLDPEEDIAPDHDYPIPEEPIEIPSEESEMKVDLSRFENKNITTGNESTGAEENASEDGAG